MPLLIKQQILVFARWPPELAHICLELKMWCRHANVHHPMHEFKHRPHHWNRSPDYNVSWIVCLGFIYSLPTICDTPDCLKSKNSPGGGAVWLQTPNTQHAAGPVRRKKKSTIGLDTKIRSVFVLIILVTQGALESSESLQRGKMRERGRHGVRGGDRGGEGVRERKGKRAAGVSGPQAVAGSWDQRLEGGAVWEVPDPSEFSVRSPNRVDSGHFHYHNTGQICPKAALFTNPATKGILEERSSREIG